MLIWDSIQTKKNSFTAFRKQFDARDVKNPILKIAVDGKYWLWINGVQIVFEGGLNRGPAPNSHYFDEVDLSSHIKNGKNTLAVLVWYWGNGGKNNLFTERAGLWTDGALVSDESFKCLELSTYQEGKPPYPAYLYGGYNIAYDANLDIGNWHAEHFDDGKWFNACQVSQEEWGKLVKRPIPLLKNYGLKDFERLDTGMEGGNQIITAYLPYAAWVSPRFEVNAAKGDFFDIRTDRYTINGGPGDEHNRYNVQRCEYIAKDGLQEFECAAAYFGEQMIFTLPKTVEIKSLKYRETGYDCGFGGDFTCDDEELNILFEKCRRTLYVCMRDNFMDCPDRERQQWIGDVSTQFPQAFYALSRSSDALLKKCIHDFINWREGGVLRGGVPGLDKFAGELPSQSLNAISSVGMIHEYYMHTGDKDILDFVIGPIENYLLLWEMDKNGLVISRRGLWPWFDHGANIAKDILENCWYALAVKFALSIMKNEILESRLRSIQAAFNAQFWTPAGYSSSGFIDDRANAMAVLAGFADEKKYETVIHVLETVKNSTPYMENYVLEAMFRTGFKKEAMARMKERYLPLIKNENTTVWEDFFVLGTRNHAWSGGPLTHLFRWVVGITPVKPGYEEFAIEPYLGHLKKVCASVETVRGTIKITIDGENGVVTGGNIEKIENKPNRYRFK